MVPADPGGARNDRTYQIAPPDDRSGGLRPCEPTLTETPAHRGLRGSETLSASSGRHDLREHGLGQDRALAADR